MYVAITRAMNRLYLTRSKSRYLYGRREPKAPSRFIAELAPELGAAALERSAYSYGGYGGGRFGGSSYGKSTYGGSRYGSEEREERSFGRALYSSDEDFQSDIPAAKSSFKAFYGGNNTTKTAANAGKYAVGMRVRHPKFGVGMIIAVKNGGNTINIAFDGQGIKELSAAIAPLEII